MNFLISFLLLGDVVCFIRWCCDDKLIKLLSSLSMLCECVTAIDGVGFTIPVGVVVEATDVDALMFERLVVCVVVDNVIAVFWSKSIFGNFS
jgi:hypothetical protein